MSTKKVCVSVNISTENNGVIKIDNITGITKLRVSSIIFKHGPRKKTKAKSKGKKKKKDDYSDSESEECRYENGNEDLMESLYMDLLINDLIRGKTYYYDGELTESGMYTTRIPLDLEYDGTGDYFKEIGYDWELSPDSKPINIDKLDIKVSTDKLLDPKVYDMLVELEFETMV